MTRNQIAVLQFLLLNANSPQVLEAVESAATGKYYTPDTSLLRRAKPGDLLCYASARTISEKTSLKPDCVRSQIKKLKNAGIIESEQLWEVFFTHTAEWVQMDGYIQMIGGKTILISAAEATSRRYSGGEYGEDVGPGANLYRILEPHIPLTDASLCKPAEQLTLPFPHIEKTILAQGARISDRKNVEISQ